MNRKDQIKSIRETDQWDVVIIGGGATGLGSALDAASRGLKTFCIERHDFSKGTSSRSTKLIHGGVRYLEQGNIKLVISALRERWFFLQNAPEMTKSIPFILPVYGWFKYFYYGVGLKLYDLLSGKLSIGKTRFLSVKEVVAAIPNVTKKGLKGGILYYDGQFDDSEICLSLARTAISYGATAINHCEAIEFIYAEKKINGLIVRDNLNGEEFKISSKIVINASGVFADEVLRSDNKKHKNIVTPSMGIHIVIDKIFYPGTHAMLIPKTTDGRVLFAVPWHDKVVIGTTDSIVKEPTEEPIASQSEIDFILNNFNKYNETHISNKNILSIFAGLRPLVKMQNIHSTANLLRDHTIFTSPSGLITITGGKWTTYRKMAKEVINKAIIEAGIVYRKCVTQSIQLLPKSAENLSSRIANEFIHPDYPYTKNDVILAVKHDMAMTLEDVLARRIRLLFLDTKAALEAAEIVADIIQKELGKDDLWKENELINFRNLAKQYLSQVN